MTLPRAPEDQDTLDMVARVKVGDRSAGDEFYRRYRDELLLTIRAGMGPRLRAAMDSEDLLQSVALEALEQLQKFEPRGPGTLRAFLNRVVRSKLVDRARGLAARKRSGAVPLTDELEADVSGKTEVRYSDPRYEALEQALLALPADLREVIRMRRFDGMPSKDIASRTGRSDASVRKLYSRAMARLSMLLVEGET